jgi:hypothetical protein
VVTRRLAAACALAAAGCSTLTDSFDTPAFSGDPFPILVETTSGAVVVGAQEPGGNPKTAVLDVLSPVTLIDRGATAAPSIDYPDLTLLGQRVAGGFFDLPRARFPAAQVLTLHPCSEPDKCNVGPDTTPRPFDALIGMNTFSNDALRLRLGTDQIFVLPDVAGDAAHRAFACDAVLPSPFRGGGTMIVGGTELPFTNWRIAIDTCLAPDPDPNKVQAARGADVLLVASTGVGVSLLGESAYARYRELVPSAPPVEALPIETVLLPSGPVSGGATTIASLALVGNSSGSPRAPCRQVYASHYLVDGNCANTLDCPCTDTTFCATPAIIEIAPPPPAGLPFLIVSDAEPTLQALRTELRPDRPEVDGVLGTSALRELELDVDYYLHGRLLGRCMDPTACGNVHIRPELVNESDRAHVAACIAR